MIVYEPSLSPTLLPLLTDSCAIITDDTVRPLYGEALKTHLEQHGKHVDLFSFPAGEASKTRETKQAVEDQLFAAGCHRKTTVIGLGGGVVTDLAGFVAATFCRGVPLVLIPTTLLGMVDAAIGGKNGINTLNLKNAIGTFYAPRAVVIDPSFLDTLPQKEWRQGWAEMVKYGCIADASLFSELEQWSQETQSLHLIQHGIAIKEAVVQRDFAEAEYRKILNFGHTVGHALEVLTAFHLSHGEAIALGMVVEASLSPSFPEKDGDRLLSLLRGLALLPETRSLPSAKDVYDVMQRDKKAYSGTPSLIFLEKIGRVVEKNGKICHPISLESFTHHWKEALDALCFPAGTLAG